MLGETAKKYVLLQIILRYLSLDTHLKEQTAYTIVDPFINTYLFRNSVEFTLSNVLASANCDSYCF